MRPLVRDENPCCSMRNVGYMSCVPCETKFIIIMSMVRYRKSLHCAAIPRPSCDQLSCLVFSQTSDSLTRKRTNTASSAGRPPMKNIGRQPQRGKTKNEHAPASRYPTA